MSLYPSLPEPAAAQAFAGASAPTAPGAFAPGAAQNPAFNPAAQNPAFNPAAQSPAAPVQPAFVRQLSGQAAVPVAAALPVAGAVPVIPQVQPTAIYPPQPGAAMRAVPEYARPYTAPAPGYAQPVVAQPGFVAQPGVVGTYAPGAQPVAAHVDRPSGASGAMLGMLCGIPFGGPIGMGIGAFIGHRIVKNQQREEKTIHIAPATGLQPVGVQLWKLGETAPLSEQGLQLLVPRKDAREMEKFIARVIQALGGTVLNFQAVRTVAARYSDVMRAPTGQVVWQPSFKALVQELAASPGVSGVRPPAVPQNSELYIADR